MINPDLVRHIISFEYIIFLMSLDFHKFSCLPLPFKGLKIKSLGLSFLKLFKI